MVAQQGGVFRVCNAPFGSTYKLLMVVPKNGNDMVLANSKLPPFGILFRVGESSQNVVEGFGVTGSVASVSYTNVSAPLWKNVKYWNCGCANARGNAAKKQTKPHVTQIPRLFIIHIMHAGAASARRAHPVFKQR